MGILVFIKKMYKKYQQVYQKFPSPMGIVVFINDEAQHLTRRTLVSVPYGDYSLYKFENSNVTHFYSGDVFPSPIGIVVFIKTIYDVILCMVYRFRPLWGL